MKNLGTKTLETNRLILRKINENDYKQAFKNWCNSDKVAKYVIWEKHENELVTKTLFGTWITEYNDQTYRWIIELKETNEVIGMISIASKYIPHSTYELGYCLGEKYWNKGIMTEVVKRVIKFLFEELDAETVCAKHLENNPGSGKVMEKSGMKYEGTLRKRYIDKDNIRNDLLVYSILKEEYYTNH